MANTKDEPEKEVQPEEIVETNEEPKEEAPPQEPEQLEEEQPQEEEAPVEEEGEEEAPQPMSKRKAERLAKLENLVSKLKGDEAPTPPNVEGLDYTKAFDPETPPEVIKQFEDDRTSAVKTGFNEGLERAKSIQFHTRLEVDAPKIENKYSIFNKESADFKPETVDTINRWYLSSVGYDAKTDTVANNNLRYSDFVEGVMELADSMAGSKVETTQKNIAKQAANTGIRPDGSASKMNLSKAPEDMTDDELKAVINRAIKK